MTTEEQLLMKGLFRLCAGIRASEVYRAASHVAVSVFLTFVTAQAFASNHIDAKLIHVLKNEMGLGCL